jgi:uncharacterized membrane protein
VFERVFAFLFKYRPVVFAQGELAFHPVWPAVVVVTLALAAVLAVGLAARRLHVGSWRIGVALVALRLGVVGLLLFSLLGPVLVVRTIEPQRNFVAVLLDDSRSMRIADLDGRPRSAVVVEAFGAQSALRRALADRFVLRFFRFASGVARVADPTTLAFEGSRSEIGAALRGATEALAGLPLSGIVLVTDGAETSDAGLAEATRALAAASVPVFAVGVGRESLGRDVELGRVQPPATVLKDTTVMVDVVVSQTGYAGRTVPLVVEDEGREIGRQEVVLPRDGEPAAVRVRFTASEPGPRLLRFRVPALSGELVAENNVREAIVEVRDRRERILYIEGEPRPEMKFLRRAVADDKNLQVVTLQRTAERKFFRLDIDDPEELAGGFPQTREELFAYRGLILGSLEASAFTPDQLRMIADFVGVRGGGLLALGGRRAFAEGGYADTPVAEALPVVLEPPKAGAEFFAEVKVAPTRLGAAHAATQVADTEAASLERWKRLPAVTTVNPLHRVKPGASILLAGSTPLARDPLVVLAYQRYGAGKSIALGVQDSWLWQMHADIPVEDDTHETFWRRLLRWLVDGVPEPVAVRPARDQVERGERLELAATVRDRTYVEVNDARVVARIVGPSGRASEHPMDLVVDRPGEYHTSFVPAEDGLYEIRVRAARGNTPLGEQTGYVRVAPSDAEYFGAAMRRPLLERLAEATGGRFYTPETMGALPEDLSYLGKGLTVVDEKELWDMPILLVLLVALLAGEWFLRRARGLP